MHHHTHPCTYLLDKYQQSSALSILLHLRSGCWPFHPIQLDAVLWLVGSFRCFVVFAEINDKHIQNSAEALWRKSAVCQRGCERLEIFAVLRCLLKSMINIYIFCWKFVDGISCLSETLWEVGFSHGFVAFAEINDKFIKISDDTLWNKLALSRRGSERSS